MSESDDIAVVKPGGWEVCAFARDHWRQMKGHPVLSGLSLVVTVGGAFGVAIHARSGWEVAAIILTGALLIELLVAWGFWKKLRAVRKDLSRALDDLIRECLDLAADFSRPFAEQYPGGQLPLVPDEKTDRAMGLYARAWELVVAGWPSLIFPFTKAANAEMERERERLPSPDEDASNAEKLEHFIQTTHSRPRIVVVGVSAGLAEVRNQLGHK